MRRLSALLMGVLAGVVTLRLIRRRTRARAATPVAGTETADDADRASALRRKLDEARERTDDAVGPATVADDDTVAGEPIVEPEVEPVAAAPEATDLADRRERVHGKAREAAESMRNGNDSGAA